MGPSESIGRSWLVNAMGPCEGIGSVSRYMRWAHARASAAAHGKCNGPIHLMTISLYYESWPTRSICPLSVDGPTRNNRSPFSSWAHVGFYDIHGDFTD